MEKWKQEILDAFSKGKTIQCNSFTEDWCDFLPQNQVDRPNLDFGSQNNWRIKPAEEEREEILRKSGAYDVTPMMKEELEEAAEKYCFTSFKWPLNKDGEKKSIPPGQIVPHGFSKHSKLVKKAFIEGALWQSKRYE